MAPARKAGSITGRIAFTVVLVGTAAAGYFCYTEYFNPPAEAAKSHGDEVANDDAGPPPVPADDSALDLDDPFNDGAGATPKSTRTGSAPRLAQHTTEAIPIQSAAKHPSGKRTGKPHPLADDTEPTLELPLDLDESADDVAEAEPESDSQPPLTVPRLPPENTATAESAVARKRSRDASDTEDDELGEFTIADDPPPNRSRAPKGPKFSIVEAQEERASAEELEGFEPEDGNRRRAVARTVVVRSENKAATAAPIGGDEDWIVDDTRPGSRAAAGRPAPSSPPTKIQPRGGITSPTGAQPRELRPAADPSPRRETYTVAPSDNFWTISRKQYGSGRYFAALAKHNQDRIPDPQRLRPGMQVATPPAAFLEERYPELIDKSGATPTPAPATSHIVPGDNRPRFGAPAVSPSTAEKSAPSQSTGAGYFRSKSGEQLYRIGADDTLSSIAQRHLGRSSRWTEIYEQNREILKNPENLPLGTVIRLPPDASRVGLAPEVERIR